MRKYKLSQFIGRQLSRLRAGQSYYILIMSTISALSLVSIAFPSISFLIIILFFPFGLVGTFFVGYLMDKTNVISIDYKKSIEMQARYLNTSDFKNNDFRMFQMEVMFEWLKSIQENKPLNYNILKEKYKIFLRKWNIIKK